MVGGSSSGWDWLQFWNDAGASLVGGVAGGGIGALVALVITGKTLRHATAEAQKAAERDAERARLAAVEERAAQRSSLNRSVAMRLLQVLAELVRWVPVLHLASAPPAQFDRDPAAFAARAAVDALIDEQQSNVLPLPLPVRQRWERLCRLALELGGLGGEPRADWPDRRLQRAQHDVTNYVRFVRASLLAIIDERELPRDWDPPVLARNPNDGSSWHHPDQQNWDLGTS
jgi:hypothetical protein